jgi:hypothetical protein
MKRERRLTANEGVAGQQLCVYVVAGVKPRKNRLSAAINRKKKKQDAAARRKQHPKHVLAADKDPARMEATKHGGWREDSDIKPRRKLQRNYLQ